MSTAIPFRGLVRLMTLIGSRVSPSNSEISFGSESEDGDDDDEESDEDEAHARKRGASKASVRKSDGESDGESDDEPVVERGPKKKLFATLIM